MALTIEEKNLMLEMLSMPANMAGANGQPMQTFGAIKATKLVEYRDKSDDEIRAELAMYTIRKRQAITQRIAKVTADKAALEAQLALIPTTEG